jgi:anti-sigma factor RsiW
VREDMREVLEEYLDGGGSAVEREAMRAKVEGDAEWRDAWETVRAERELRADCFAEIESNGEGARRVEARVLEAVARQRRRRTGFAWAARAGALAACVAVGFSLGWFGKQGGPPQQVVESNAGGAVYQVAITDEAGDVIAVQKFESLEQAKEFSADLERWQERQEDLVEGQATIRSARF